MADQVAGGEHFRTTVQKGLEIMQALRGWTSGLAVPQFVIDSPGGGGKVPLLPEYLESMNDDEVVFRNYEGKRFVYKQPRAVPAVPAELEPAARGTARFPDYLTALTGLFASIGATTVLTSETTAFFGPAFELPHGLAFVADNVLLLRYAELESEVRRVLAIVKLRDGDHTKNLLEIQITKTGMTVIGKFSGLTGVLGGNPTLTPPTETEPHADS
jgi:hypothetical protein